MNQSLTQNARSLAGQILGALPERLAHSEAVAARADELAVTVPSASVDAVIAAAWLHDLGYAPTLKVSGFHPLDGAWFLRRAGWPNMVCALVAHHSGSRFLARVQGLELQLAEFDFEESPESDAITVADNTAGPNGTLMTIEQRLRDKARRHGPDSPNARANPERDDYIRAAGQRVQHRLDASMRRPR